MPNPVDELPRSNASSATRRYALALTLARDIKAARMTKIHAVLLYRIAFGTDFGMSLLAIDIAIGDTNAGTISEELGEILEW